MSAEADETREAIRFPRNRHLVTTWRTSSPARAIDIVETYGAERLWMNSACDWGVSIPLSIPLTALEMRRRGHSAGAVDRLIYQNPHDFMSQCPKFGI